MSRWGFSQIAPALAGNDGIGILRVHLPLGWIVAYVLPNPVQFFIVSDDALMVVALPQTPIEWPPSIRPHASCIFHSEDLYAPITSPNVGATLGACPWLTVVIRRCASFVNSGSGAWVRHYTPQPKAVASRVPLAATLGQPRNRKLRVATAMIPSDRFDQWGGHPGPVAVRAYFQDAVRYRPRRPGRPGTRRPRRGRVASWVRYVSGRAVGSS